MHFSIAPLALLFAAAPAAGEHEGVVRRNTASANADLGLFYAMSQTRVFLASIERKRAIQFLSFDATGMGFLFLSFFSDSF